MILVGPVFDLGGCIRDNPFTTSFVLLVETCQCSIFDSQHMSQALLTFPNNHFNQIFDSDSHHLARNECRTTLIGRLTFTKLLDSTDNA